MTCPLAHGRCTFNFVRTENYPFLYLAGVRENLCRRTQSSASLRLTLAATI